MENQIPNTKENKTYDKKDFKNIYHIYSNFPYDIYLIWPHLVYTFNIKILFVKSYNHYKLSNGKVIDFLCL